MTLGERIVFSQLYPEATNILSALLLRNIKEKVELSQKEASSIDLKILENRMTWDVAKDKATTIGFSCAEVRFLKDRISELDKQNKIQLNLLDIILKIQDVNIEANTCGDEDKKKKRR